MAFVDTLTDSIQNILDIGWDERDGNVIPTTDNITLKNGAVKIKATFLYADLAGSSVLADKCPWGVTAKIIRTYLDTAVRLIKNYGGEIRSFDGDRVMGIFKDGNPNTNAANCARNIDWMVNNVINLKANEKFESICDNSIRIKHCVGVDTSEARAVRAGIRDNNDLIWIGKAPSFAAKLSDIRDYPNEVYISGACYDAMLDSAKKDGDVNVWTETDFVYANSNYKVYKTGRPLKP